MFKAKDNSSTNARFDGRDELVLVILALVIPLVSLASMF